MTGLCVLPHEQPAETWIGLLCRRHRARLDRDVDEIAALIIDASRIRDGGAPSETTPKTRRLKAAEAPAPGDVRLMAMFDPRTAVARIPGSDADPKGDQSQPEVPVTAIVASWVLLVAEERPLEVVLPRSVLGQLDLLRRHADWMASQAWIDDYVLELTELRKALASAVSDHPVTRVGTCHLTVGDSVCGGALLRENGSSAVSCRKCGASWVTAQQIARLAVGE